jgi:hypothetical protein
MEGSLLEERLDGTVAYYGHERATLSSRRRPNGYVHFVRHTVSTPTSKVVVAFVCKTWTAVTYARAAMAVLMQPVGRVEMGQRTALPISLTQSRSWARLLG